MSNRRMILTQEPKNLFLLSLMAMFSLFSSVVAAAQTTVSPTSVNFGNVVVGTAGALHEIAFKNTGTSSISVSSISVTAGGPYALAPAPSTTCPNPGLLAAGASCYVGLKLTPTTLGAQPAGTLTINSTAATGGTQSVALSGTGVNATVLSSTALNFYGVVVNTTSAPKGIYLANYELTAITVSPITVAAPYAISSDACGSTLGPNASCLIGITLTPTTLGVVAAENLTINTSAPNSPLTAALTGTGSAPTQLSPTSLNFGSVVTGSTSAIKSVTLYNWQLTPLSILSITPPTQYAVASTTCGSTLAASSTCIISLTLTPTAVGPVPAGSLKIVTNASDSPDTLPLTGSGAGPTVLSPTAVSFGSVVENSASPLRIVTLTNEQPTNLTVSSLALTAGTPYAIDPSSTCTTPTVLPGASCTVALTVTPTSVGAQPAATLTITTSASNSPQTVALSATGAAPVILSASALNLGHVIVGTTSTATSLTVKNLQTSALNFTGAAFNGPFVLDTGAVTTCPQSGGTLGGSLAAGASCVVGIDFKPTTLGQTSGGQIALLDSAPNSPQTVMLVGVGALPVQVLPAALGFGGVVVGTMSAAKTVTLTNDQSGALNLSSISAPAPYAVDPGTTGTPCAVGTPVAPGASCTLNVIFTPTAPGAVPADNLSIVDNGTNSPQLVSLSGDGVAAITLPTALGFGNVVVGEVTTKSVTLKNNQSLGLNISSISGFSGGYSLNTTATTCSLTSALPAGQSCVIAVNLTPSTLGVQPAASFSVADGVAGSPQTVNLTANAITAVVVSPGSVSFPTTFVGLTSAAKTVTLTNEQSIPLTISSAIIAGADPADFALTSSCPTAPATLSGPGACTLNVTFTPTASGTRTATLTITDGVTGSPQSIALSGPGNAPVTVTPGTVQNYSVPVGTTSAYRVFTINNLQMATTLHFSSFELEGDFIQSATTCPIGGIGIAPGATCTLAVEFDPSIGGIRNGQLQVYDDALTSPQVVNLSGSGVFPLTISPGGYSFQSQTVGTVSPAKAFTLTNHETESETFSIAAVGSLAAADYTANTNCTSGVIAAQSSCLIYVNFTPTSISPSPTRTGTLTVTDSAPGGVPITAPLSGSAIATNPPAAVAVVSPGAGASGTVVPVIITGNGWTHFSNSSTIAFVETTSPATACDIAVSAISAPTANTINATLTISGGIYGACNIAVKTPLSGGGTETASLISAFTIADPTQAHIVASVTPAFGSQGETMNVAIAAVGTHFVQGVTIANFGDGVSMNSLTIHDATDATANITISNTTPVGYRTVTMQTNGEFAVSGQTPQGNAIFQIGPNNATLVSVSPNAEAQGWSGAVTLTATGTHFLQNATQVTIGGAIVGDVNVTSPTVAVAEVAVPAGAPLGPQNVQVATGGEITGLPNAFTITGATPALLSVAPSSGIQGQQNLNVVITGNAYTTFTTGALSADFTGEITVNSVTPTAANSVTVNISISQAANVGSITATLISGTTNFPFTFTVLPSSASIVSVSPTCVPQGGQLTLSVIGSNTNWLQATTTSAFYVEGVPTPSVDEVTINSPTSASLAVAVPTTSPAGTYGFYLATGGQIVSASIQVCPATPTLTMSPANGLLPTAPAVNSFTVNFTGQFTHWGATTLPVISGEGVTLSNFVVQTPVSATGTITIIAGTNGTPTATGSRLVTFTTGGEIVTTNFNVTSTPVGIISVSPDHTPPSTTVNVAIVGLNTHFASGTTQVLFGPQITVNSITVTDATHLTANISTSYMLSGTLTPSPSGWQSIYVNTGAEQVIAGFLVDYPTLPSLVSVSPSSGAQGATLSDVVITGNLTSWAQGTTEAILGAGVTVSNLTVTSPTSATATIAISPTAPIGGNTVVMITGTEIESGSGFSVTPSAAYIQSVGPAVACTGNFTLAGIPGCGTGSSAPWVVAQLQTTSLNIVGVGTHWLQGETAVSFGSGVIVDQLAVTSPTTATVQITVLSAAPVGFATLTTTTDGEVVALQQAIDIEEGSPILLAISPNVGQQGTTATVQILGRFTNFNASTTSAAFNQDIMVTSINVIDSENMTANITISPNAYVDSGSPCGHVLTITTGNEQVSTSQTPGSEYNFCVQQGAEEITAVAPNSGLQGSSESVTITGSATNFINGVSTVSLGDSGIAEGTVVVASPTSLTVPLAISTSSSTGYHTVTVTTLGEVATQQFAFTVVPGVATLNEAIPNQLEQGVQNVTVRLIGQYSHFSASSTATMGAGITIDSVSNVSPTEEDAVISIDPLSYTGGRTVTVSTPNVSCAYQPNSPVVGVTYSGCTPGSPNGTGTEIVTANVFAIIPGPAIISSVAPATGNEGQEVVFNITGSATHWAQNFTQFYIAGGGSDLTINSVVINSATSATVDLSISTTANPGARSIYMVTNGESLTDSGAFVVTGGVPVITYLSPSSQQNPAGGTTGLQVDIYGLYTNWATGSSTVSFGPGITVESFQVDNATHIEAVIDIAAGAQNGYRTVVVQTGTQGLLGNFQVTPVAPPPTPYIWYLSPGSGLPGQTFTVTFNGAYTQWNPDTTVLEGFASGITVNTFQVTSPTSARANITISPTATASVSDLTLTTGSEVDSAQFSVVVAVPTLSIVDPGSGIQGATNLTVDILGQYTTFDSTTTFSFGSGVTTVGPPTILGPTIATQVINIAQLAPLGGSGVIANTPDASASAQTVGGASFSVTPSLALISAITPNTAPQGTTLTVEVTGQNTHWDAATTFQFGAGIVVTSVAVNSETDATVTLAIPALASEGPTGATAQTAGEVANITNGFVVTAGTPLLLSTGPGSVPQQDSAVFTILSQATTWSAATPPTVSYGPGITLTNVNVTGPTSLTVEGYVIPTTPVGYYPLTVSTGTQVLSLNNAVYVGPGPAVINNLTPNIGDQGVNLPAVQINGINTHWAQGVTQLTFPDVLINSFTVNSPTLITADITVNTTAVAGQYSVTATTGGEVATGVNVFTVSQSEPELLAVVPSSGVQGLTSSPVTITGAFTTFVNGTTTANFGTGITVNSVTVTSATQAQANITVQPTTTLGYRNVSVTTGTQVVNLTNGYQVTQGPAEIVGPLSPASGGEGNSYNVVVTGSQTHFAQNVTTAAFGGGIQVTGVTVTSLLSATVSITIPNSTPTGAYNVTLTTGGEVATILGGFTVTNGSAQISAVNPPTGTQGLSNLNVALTGTFTHWVNGTSVASFGAGITVNTLTVSDATDAVANITISTSAAIGSRNVTVTTGSEVASITGGFSVLAGVPTLLSALPTTAQAGTTANIVLTGTFTNFQQGFSTVSFGSGVTVNLVTVSSATQLTANISVSSSASVGNREITVTTNSQVVSLNNGFSVTAGTPAITQINPNIGTDGQTLNVSLSGVYTNWVQGTTTISFGSGITVNSVTVSNATNLTANITIGASTPTGPVSVMTTTGGEVENVPGGFTVDPVTVPSPTLLSLSPSPSAGVMPINSNIIAVFSQPMNRTTITTSTVTLTLTSNPNGYIAVPISVNLDATGRILTITPTGLLGVNSTFNLIMTSGIQDAAGTAFSYYSQDLYTVDAANTTSTTLVTANPPANASNVGTNVVVQLEFSTTMNQSTQSGVTVMNGGTAVPGTISWNSNPYCCGTGWAQPGTVLTFTPTSPLAAGTTYTVSYGTPLADTAGNAVTPGSFSFTTGSGADTATNSVHFNFESGQTNLGTNFVPAVTFAKPINPIDITTSTLMLYNADSGKYIGGSVNVAPNGMSATFTPTYPLLPDTYYYLYMSSGYYDMDGNYLYGTDQYFTTGAGSDTTPPTVASVSPLNNATSAPLNAEVVVHFSAAINSSTVTNALTVTPSGGSAIAGTATLGSDLVTLTFVPTDLLQSNTVYTVQVSGYQDMVGNVGTPFTSSFTTATSSTVINVSTGLNASGGLITTNNTNDGHWVVYTTGITSTPSESTFGSPALGAAQPLLTVGQGDAGFYSGWPADGPTSDWVNINPNSNQGNTFGLYYTTFNVPGPTVPSNLCLVGTLAIADNGLLAINGTAIMGNLGNQDSLNPINIPVSSSLVVGSNTLALGWGSNDNNYEGLRLGASIQTCGASYSGGLTLTSATPANNATGVATNTTITLNFNNTLDPATVNSNTLPILLTWNGTNQVGGTYQVSGNQVIFTPDSPFPVSTQVWVGALNGPYDTAGDAAAGTGYVQLSNFTTGSTVVAPPAAFQVLAFAPASNATNVGLRAPVAATFNRSVSPGSINQNSANSDFALFAGDAQSPWCGSYSRSQDNTTLSFNCYPLPGSTVMTAFLNSNLTDWSGNPLTNFSSQFTTSPPDSNTNGSVITTRPGNGASGINVNEPLTLYSNLPINASTADGGIQVAQNNVAVPGSVAVLDNGYTLEFTPSSAWTQGALIQWWTNTSLLDSTYNTPINAASGYFYAAASTSTLVPAVQVASPTYGATAPTNSIVDLQFNTPLNASTVNSTNIYLYDGNTTLHLAGTYSMPQPNEVRIVPSASFTAGHYIYVYVTTGLQSTTSVPFGSTTYVVYFYTGTSADTTLPTIVSAVPYNGSTNVGVNVTPGVVISKAIDPVSVNSTTFQVTSGGTPLPGTFWFNSSDTRVEFMPNAPLPASTSLVMKVNGVLDPVGNPITSTTSFQTGPGPDFTAPTIVWTSVTSNESIPVNSSITVQFSESMDVTSFSNGNFFIQDQVTDTQIPATLTWNANQTIAYLTPTSPLDAGRQYYFYVYSGTDLAGNAVQGESFYFYAEFTSATTAPTVINFNPLSGATGLGTNAIIEAQFSAPINPNSVSGVTLTQGGTTVTTSPVVSAGNTVLQLVPATPLAPSTTYTMHIAGVMDPAGNPVAPVNNSFTTGTTYDINPATAISSDPPANATVGTNVTPKLVFNKALNPLTVNNSTFRMYLYDTGQFIPLTVTESTNGMEVTMTPQIPLLANTHYYFQACCGFQDQDGNDGNGVTIYFWTNGGADTTGPTVTVSPLNAATGIPLNAQVTASVSANIDPTTVTQTSIQVLKSGTPIAGTVTEPNNQELLFTPASALTASTTYTVQVSGFTDANGNAVVPFTSTFTTGTIAATGGLTLTSTSIVNGTNVTNNLTPVTLTFNQTLNPSTVNLSTFLVEYSNGGLAGTYVVNGNAVTFTPSNPYPPNATIYVEATGGLTDVAGDAYGGNPGNGFQQLLDFTTTGSTPDNTPLTVLSVNPTSGATNVRPDMPVSVTFNKSINPGTATSNNGGNNALLFAGQSVQTHGYSITMSPDNRTMTFNSGTLSTGTAYTIQLLAGGISDPSGNTLAATYSSSFTTGTNPATGNGGVQSVAPGFNATGVPTDSLLTLYMNRQVDAASLSGQLTVTVNGAVYAGTVQSVASGFEIQFTPGTPFPNGATVQWFLSGSVLDVNGDAFTGNSGTFYTVAAVNTATAPPTMIDVSPVYGSSTMPINGEIDIAFTLPIDPTTVGGGNVYFNTGTAATISVLAAPNNNIIRVVPNANLTPGDTYYVCANSSVKGTNGVTIPGSCWNTIFSVPTTATTPDTTPGTVAIGPPNGSVNVGTNGYIRLWFSKPVDSTTINSTNVAVKSGGVAIPGTWGYNYTNSDIREVNFSPVNPLPPSTSITVSVSGLLDYAGNTFTPASASFTTGALPDYTTPTATLDFGGGTTGIGTNAAFTCLYSEPMDPSSVTTSNTYVYSYVTNASIPVTYTWASDMLSVTMTPTKALFANSEYYYYCGGAIDLTGNGMSNTDVYFYTGNGPTTTGPALVYANPPSGMANVPLNSGAGPWNSTSLMLLFNEPVSTESMANITFTPNGGSAEPIAVYPEDGNFIADVQLPWAMAPSTTYTFNFAGVTDLNGNPVTGTTTSSFTTGTGFDWSSPTATATPANNATGVAVNAPLTVTFSELMNEALITSSQIYLRYTNTQVTVPTTLAISTVGGVTVVTLTPTSPLAESTKYDLVYWPNNWYLYDVAGNSEGNYGVETTFTTGTTTAVNGACGTANGQTFSSAPAANLCSAGTASAVTNPGSWTWSCNGNYGGTNASCSATVSGTPSCSPQLSSLVSLWPGNNNANDVGPGGNNGTLENGVSYGLGEVGDAFSLSGSDQYVLIGQPVPANLQIQNAITLSAWIYPTALPTSVGGGGTYGMIAGSQMDGVYGGATIFFDGNTDPDGNSGVPPGHITFQIGDGSEWHETDALTQAPLNQWTLVTAIRAANSAAQIYYNGVLQPSTSASPAWTGTISYPSTDWFAIGQEVNEDRPFTGLINDVAVYNAALTGPQVLAIYNAGSGGVCQ
ncbi:MAG TPA: Ig-like domain-containing protein [Terracidiphilus sp.]